MDWLAARETYWRNEIRRREESLRLADDALQRCRASGHYVNGPYGMVYVEPPCTMQWEAVRYARVYLEAARAELRNVQEWKRLVQKTANDYQREAQRLALWVSGQLPKASAFLEHKITRLQSYVMLGVPSGSYITTPPVRAVGETFAAAVGLAALGVGLTAATVAVIRWLAADVRHTLGAVGEELSAQLIREQPGFQELRFDQPKHGFDRVFTAPGLPLVVMESKVTSTGTFHPGQTKHGEQGSPGWIAAQADKMADPTSAQWSPVNERIAAMVKDLGAENVPAVAVVIQSETGLADVYVRPVGQESWQPLKEGISLAEALAGAGATGTHPETSGGVESERGFESPEGSSGGPERG